MNGKNDRYTVTQAQLQRQVGRARRAGRFTGNKFLPLFKLFVSFQR